MKTGTLTLTPNVVRTIIINFIRGLEVELDGHSPKRIEIECREDDDMWDLIDMPAIVVTCSYSEAVE